MKQKKRDLTKHFVRHWVVMAFAAIASYFFYFAMARMLSVEDYSILYTLTAITWIFTIPNETIRTVVARYTVKFKDNKKIGELKSFIFWSLKKMFILSILLFVIFLLISPLLKSSLNIPFWMLLVVGSFLLFNFMLPVLWGVMQGVSRFGHLGFNHTIEMLVKTGIAVVLVSIGFGLWGALIAFPASIAFAFAAGFIPIRDIIKIKKKKYKLKEVSKYSIATFVIFAFLVTFYSVDIIIARYFFSERISGLYAGISVTSKVVLFASMAIVRVMFPFILIESEKKKSEKTKRKNVNKILIKSSKFILIFSSLFIILSLILPEQTIIVFLGYKYLEVAPLLIYAVLSMIFLSFSTMIVFYNLSLDWHKKLTARILGTFLFLETALLILFHLSLKQFLMIILLVNILLFLALLITLKKPKH